MPAENASGYDSPTPVPEDTGQEETPARQSRRGGAVWAVLATLLILAIVILLLLTQCVPRVPDVVGLTEKQAVTKLKDSGYEIGDISRIALQKTPAGKVGEQAPVAGAVYARGKNVDLIVALGSELTRVPDVVGQDTPAAQLLLEAKDLKMDVVGEYSIVVQPGAIISQEPRAGTEVLLGTKVVTVVSLGAKPETASTSGGSTSAGITSSGGSSGSGTGSSSSSSNCTAAYPNASVWSSGGDIYIRLKPGGSTRRLTSGSSWDDKPLLAPSGKYVVFMRAPASNKTPEQIGRVCLTDFKVSMIQPPRSSGQTSGYIWYPDYRFAPSPTGTSPGSDWLVIVEYWEEPLTGPANPDPAQNLRGRLVVCNVPLASSWVSWNIAFMPTGGISLAKSSRPGCVRVNAKLLGGAPWKRDFNVYTGMYMK